MSPEFRQNNPKLTFRRLKVVAAAHSTMNTSNVRRCMVPSPHRLQPHNRLFTINALHAHLFLSTLPWCPIPPITLEVTFVLILLVSIRWVVITITGCLPHGHFCCGTYSFDTGAASFLSAPKQLTIFILLPTYPVVLPKIPAWNTHRNITSTNSLKSNFAAKKTPPSTCFLPFLWGRLRQCGWAQ